MKNLSKHAIRFLSHEPAKIGSILGHVFYEHPTKGDESPLYRLSPEGAIHRTDYWEMPSFDEFCDHMNCSVQPGGTHAL